jgi:hypothetical protein
MSKTSKASARTKTSSACRTGLCIEILGSPRQSLNVLRVRRLTNTFARAEGIAGGWRLTLKLSLDDQPKRLAHLLADHHNGNGRVDLEVIGAQSQERKAISRQAELATRPGGYEASHQTVTLCGTTNTPAAFCGELQRR